jgi:hypothetical protein
MGSVRTVVSATCLLILFSPLPVGAQTGVAPAALKTQIDQQMPELTTTYKQLHQYPELSHHEEKTSAYLAGELRNGVPGIFCTSSFPAGLGAEHFNRTS